jgi:hypothetical protein
MRPYPGHDKISSRTRYDLRPLWPNLECIGRINVLVDSREVPCMPHYPYFKAIHSTVISHDMVTTFLQSIISSTFTHSLKTSVVFLLAFQGNSRIYLSCSGTRMDYDDIPEISQISGERYFIDELVRTLCADLPWKCTCKMREHGLCLCSGSWCLVVDEWKTTSYCLVSSHTLIKFGCHSLVGICLVFTTL